MSLHVETLEQSFDLVAPRGQELVEMLYARLFELAPQTLQLFSNTSLEDRYRTMLATLMVLRNSLRKLETILPALEALGRRHAEYGVRPEYYAPAGQALLESMQAIAGDAWRSDYTDAWAAAYSAVSGVMIAGARQEIAV